MELAKEFHDTFKERIVEYHISGYHPIYNHYPLFKTKQDIILEYVIINNIPIIIESDFDKSGEHSKEINYIFNKLT